MDINIDRIRSEMKNREQWLCWEAAMRDGKETKLPKDPETGDFAQTDDPSTWGSFLNANGKVKAGQMDGIGFVFTEDDNYVGIDLDNCRDPETGEWEDWALDVMQDIGGWIEISPSGTGAHIILKGELPGDRNRKGDIEMYEDGRFFTVTGQLVDENGERLDDDEDTPEIKEAQQALDAVYDRFLAEEDESANETDVNVDPDKWGHLDLEDHGDDSRTSHSGGPNIDDLPPELREIVETAKAANNGYRFTQLWRGNWEEYYPSHSEGDMGFCDMLAFWFSGDPERMDRVFRASGLMRPKWDDVRYSDGSTYGERTIEKAIAEVNDHYDDEYYNDLVDDQEDEGRDDHETNDNDEDESDSEETSSDDNEDDDDDGAEFSSEDANESESSPSPETSDTESENSTTANSNSGESTSNDTSESDDNAQDSDRRRTRGRSGGRGRGSGRKRSQKRRDGIPDDIVSSSNSRGKESSSSPGPSGDSNGDADGDDEEEFYTELNFDTDPDANGDESEDGVVDDDIFDDGPADGDRDEEELPSEDEAASIFDDMGEEDDSSSTPGSETDVPDTTDDDFASDSESGRSETSSDVGESESTTPSDSTSSEETNGQQSSQEKGTSDRTGDRPGESEDGLGRFEKKTETRLEDIEAELSRLDEELERAKAELRHDVELEDDKLERVYWELQQYENIVDKREKQLETMYQLLVLLCHVQPEPLFDRVENILLSEEGIPPKNIFNESVEEIIDHYHEETAAMDSSAEPEPVDEAMGGDGRSKRTSPSEPSGASERPTSEQVRTNGDGDLPHDESGEEEDEETSFLSQFF